MTLGHSTLWFPKHGSKFHQINASVAWTLDFESRVSNTNQIRIMYHPPEKGMGKWMKNVPKNPKTRVLFWTYPFSTETMEVLGERVTWGKKTHVNRANVPYGKNRGTITSVFKRSHRFTRFCHQPFHCPKSCHHQGVSTLHPVVVVVVGAKVPQRCRRWPNPTGKCDPRLVEDEFNKCETTKDKLRLSYIIALFILTTGMF